MHRRSALLLLLVLWSGFVLSPDVRVGADPQDLPAGLRTALAGIAGSRILVDVTQLSHARFSGRLTGTTDDLESATYVADRFRDLGLQPAGTDSLPFHPARELWAQTMPVNTGWIRTPAELVLSFTNTLITAREGFDFLPALDSPSAKIRAPVAFVGYGLSDASSGYDDYAGLDVNGRVVLFLRGKPEQYPHPVDHTDKIRIAQTKGAVAYLTVTGPLLSAYEARRGVTSSPKGSYGAPTGPAEEEFPLPGAWISTDLAEKLLAAGGQSLREAQAALNSGGTPRSMLTPVITQMTWDSRTEPGTLVNILAIIPATRNATARPEQTVVVGAHRDHLGRHGEVLFPGADDNASGTAVVLEVARALAQSGLRPRRTILFASFSGEEQGLLGSKRYVHHALRSLDQTTAMINIDHAGVGNGRITVGVAGLEKAIPMRAGTAAGLLERLDLYGYFPGGDHVPFKEAGVPTVTVVSSGQHPDFHQPTDTADKVRPDILEAVARFILALTWELADAPGEPPLPSLSAPHH